MCIVQLIDKHSDIEYTDRKTLEDLYAKSVKKYEEVYEALSEMQRISEKNGNSEMTMEEINHEIDEARKEMDMKESHSKKCEAFR